MGMGSSLGVLNVVSTGHRWLWSSNINAAEVYDLCYVNFTFMKNKSGPWSPSPRTVHDGQ